jgi:molybdate transport system substrate-binding protein
MTDDLSFLSECTVGMHAWVERAGQAVLGPGRLELLESINRCHSISAAARQVGMSYRHAWVLVQAINRAAGEPLVVAATGGRRGGGALLTTCGELAVRAFRDVQDHLRRAASAVLPRLLAGPGAPCVHVAAAVSLEDVLGHLLVDYAARRPATRVRAVFGASDELADQLVEGAPADLFLSADARQLDRLERLGVAEAKATAFAENTLLALGGAGRNLTARTAADLLGPEVRRIALASPSCPLGSYTRAYLEGQGLYDRFLSRAVLVDHARAVVAAVQAGQADVGMVYGSAILTAASCRVLFRARRPSPAIRYVGVVTRWARQPEQARSFLEYLTSPPALRHLRRCGFRRVRA